MTTINDLTLTKDPYLDGDVYSAHATDKQDNEYMVHWEIKPNDSPDGWEDEQEACDWDKPLFITKL
jgi:hypothetical protein